MALPHQMLILLHPHAAVCSVCSHGNLLEAAELLSHASQLDSVVLMSMFAPSGVAKASIASWPLVGTCVSAFNVRFLRLMHVR